VLKTLERERVTGLTAVPPLYIQLAALEWPAEVQQRLRYFANTGGRMPRETLTLLRRRLPKSKPFLMYGLTEAFRSTYLPPEEVDLRPDSIGKAIPNAEILVLRDDGTLCGDDEPGELVHRGALVGLGYWNDAVKTAERYKRFPRHGGASDRLAIARDGGVLRRHRSSRRRRIPVLHRPKRRDDQDLRLSRQPDRGRGDLVCDQARRRMRGVRCRQ
jgi:acyl-CoA synthetase (AMP-forming)/AMP-acid ligase II